jgi:hypothetical protein
VCDELEPGRIPGSSRAWVLTMVILMSACQDVWPQCWPLEPPYEDHPIGNSFGEYLLGGYHHLGIDILGQPALAGDREDPSAPYVVAARAGWVEVLINNADDIENEVRIRAEDGKLYRYLHLQRDSYTDGFLYHWENYGKVPEGKRIAQIAPWPDCTPPFHHLHFEVRTADETVALNPMATGFLDPDLKIPQSGGIFLAKDDGLHGRWTPFGAAADGACPVVSGKTDIIVQAWDRNEAGSTHPGAQALWVKNVRWRGCPESTPECPWKSTYVFDSIPGKWGEKNNKWTAAYFSSEAPWVSSKSYCQTDPHYAVVTNFAGGQPDQKGSWDTTGLSGTYIISVELTDFAGNKNVFNRRVCVENPPSSSTTELTIRDGEKDGGAVPFLRGNWEKSPDIAVNPGTPHEDIAILLGMENKIAVRVWNLGSSTLPLGTEYEVCLGWAPESSAVAHPLPPQQRIACKTELLSAPWSPGSSRTTTFQWTPDAMALTAGSHSLVTWVHHPSDPVQNTSSVHLDDNRAQRNVGFLLAAFWWGAPPSFERPRVRRAVPDPLTGLVACWVR